MGKLSLPDGERDSIRQRWDHCGAVDLRSLDLHDPVPEAGYPVKAVDVGDGVDEQEPITLPQVLFTHGAVLVLASGVQHCPYRQKINQPVLILFTVCTVITQNRV